MTNPIASPEATDPSAREASRDPERLYEVPFTFTLRGTYVTLASSAAEATKRAASLLDYDPDILPNSNAFWEEGTPIFDLSCDGPLLSPATPSSHDPDDFE